jgi:predicted DNA binding protein
MARKSGRREDGAAAFDVFRSRERIDALCVLGRREPPVDLWTLAGEAGDASSRDATALHHVHLPRLDDVGVVDYDADRRVVTAVDGVRLAALVGAGGRRLASLEADDRLRTDGGSRVSDGGHDPSAGLTDDQRELLRLAHREGCYRIPREITLRELAERTGVSDREASRALRRGVGSLLGATLEPVEESTARDGS